MCDSYFRLTAGDSSCVHVICKSKRYKFCIVSFHHMQSCRSIAEHQMSESVFHLYFGTKQKNTTEDEFGFVGL